MRRFFGPEKDDFQLIWGRNHDSLPIHQAHAHVAELVDALSSGGSALWAWRFDSSRAHHIINGLRIFTPLDYPSDNTKVQHTFPRIPVRFAVRSNLHP